MGVIINDFDVAAEAPQEAAGQESQPGVSPPAASLTSREVWDLLVRQAERMARIRAD